MRVQVIQPIGRSGPIATAARHTRRERPGDHLGGPHAKRNRGPRRTPARRATAQSAVWRPPMSAATPHQRPGTDHHGQGVNRASVHDQQQTRRPSNSKGGPTPGRMGRTITGQGTHPHRVVGNHALATSADRRGKASRSGSTAARTEQEQPSTGDGREYGPHKRWPEGANRPHHRSVLGSSPGGDWKRPGPAAAATGCLARCHTADRAAAQGTHGVGTMHESGRPPGAAAGTARGHQQRPWNAHSVQATTPAAAERTTRWRGHWHGTRRIQASGPGLLTSLWVKHVAAVRPRALRTGITECLAHSAVGTVNPRERTALRNTRADRRVTG